MTKRVILLVFEWIFTAGTVTAPGLVASTLQQSLLLISLSYTNIFKNVSVFSNLVQLLENSGLKQDLLILALLAFLPKMSWLTFLYIVRSLAALTSPTRYWQCPQCPCVTTKNVSRR